MRDTIALARAVCGRRAPTRTGGRSCWVCRPRPRTLRDALSARAFRRTAPARKHRARTRHRARLLILDEAVSALDKSIEAQILNLLQELKSGFAHIRLHFARPQRGAFHQRSGDGDVSRQGRRDRAGRRIYGNPRHPYTRALLSSRPSMSARQRQHGAASTGSPPSPINPPSGCRFRTRCPLPKTSAAKSSLRSPNKATARCHAMRDAPAPDIGKAAQ